MFFLFLISLPSAPDLALGKDLIFFNSLPSVSDLALGKEFFLFLKYFGECPWTALGKDLIFFIISLPSAPVDALGKEEILKKIKTFFAECLMAGTRQRHPLPSAMPRHSAKFFCFFVFGLQFFCAVFLKHQELLVTIWGFFVAFCYI